MEMATTSTRAAQSRRTKSAPRVSARPAPARTTGGSTAPRKAQMNRLAIGGGPEAEMAAPPNKQTRAERLLASIESVQAPRRSQKIAWPRWKKILLWAVMLMPAYAIIIYIIGAFYFLPYELRGVGLNKSFTTHVQSMAGPFAVPDQEGVFLQTSAKPKSLSMIMQYNDSSLQPPVNEQMVLAPNGLRYILIRQAQVSKPTDYQVFPLGSTTPVKLTAQRVPASGVAVVALAMPGDKPWAKGSYEIVVPEAGLDDQLYYCYFTIS
jgi:hypothetical protein